MRGVPRQAAARPPSHGLRHAGRSHGRRDPRAGAEDPDARRGAKRAPVDVRSAVHAKTRLTGHPMQRSSSRRRAAPRRSAASPAPRTRCCRSCARRCWPTSRCRSATCRTCTTCVTTCEAAGRAGRRHRSTRAIGKRIAHRRRSAQRATAMSRRTNWSRPCAPRCWCSARCWRNTARPKSRCPAAARSARARSTSTSRACRRWAPRSASTTASSRRSAEAPARARAWCSTWSASAPPRTC